MSQILLDIKNKIFELMDQGKYRKSAKILEDAFHRIDHTNLSEFGDLIVELVRKDPESFTEKIYVWFEFLFRKSPQEKLYELDKYIIENYGLIKGENVLDSFYGSLADNYRQISGRVFLTNLRIIASGHTIPKSKTSGSKSLIGTASLIRKGLIHVAIGKAIRKTLNKDIDELELLPYAYYYPIYNAYKVKRGKSGVTYHLNIDYERKGKTKTEKLDIIVSIAKKIKDPSRKTEILNKFENLLTQNQ